MGTNRGEKLEIQEEPKCLFRNCSVWKAVGCAKSFFFLKVHAASAFLEFDIITRDPMIKFTVILLVGLGCLSGIAAECANACKFFFLLLFLYICPIIYHFVYFFQATDMANAPLTICVFATVTGRPMTAVSVSACLDWPMLIHQKVIWTCRVT